MVMSLPPFEQIGPQDGPCVEHPQSRRLIKAFNHSKRAVKLMDAPWNDCCWYRPPWNQQQTWRAALLFPTRDVLLQVLLIWTYFDNSELMDFCSWEKKVVRRPLQLYDTTLKPVFFGAELWTNQGDIHPAGGCFVHKPPVFWHLTGPGHDFLYAFWQILKKSMHFCRFFCSFSLPPWLNLSLPSLLPSSFPLFPCCFLCSPLTSDGPQCCMLAT